MNFPRPYTPINYDIKIDANDEIGLQPNKRPIMILNWKNEKDEKLKNKTVN